MTLFFRCEVYTLFQSECNDTEKGCITAARWLNTSFVYNTLFVFESEQTNRLMRFRVGFVRLIYPQPKSPLLSKCRFKTASDFYRLSPFNKRR